MKCSECKIRMIRAIVYKCISCKETRVQEKPTNAFSEYVRRKNYMSGIKE